MRNLAIAIAASGLVLLGIGGCSVLSAPGPQQSQQGGSGGGTSSGVGGGIDDGGGPSEIDGPNTGGPSTGPSSSEAGSTGSVDPGVCMYGGPPDQQIVTVPDPTRAVDSAVYARAALLENLAPDPSVLRLNDFLNLYGSPKTYEGSPSVGEVEYLYAAGVVEARFPMPDPPAHTQRSFVILVDTSLSMIPGFDLERSVVEAVGGKLDGAQGDELRVVGWSDVLQTLYQGPPTTDLDGALAPAFATPGGSSDLGAALTKTLALALATSSPEKHVLVLTDGGASTNSAPNAISNYAASDVHLDVVMIAPQSRLSDSKTPGQASAYNQDLLTELTEADGARLLVSDAMDPSGKSDVDALFTDRFEELFGTAFTNPRAIFTIPTMLKFVASGLVAQDTSELVSRDVGYNRMLTLRVRVDDQSPGPVQLPLACGDQLITASLDGVQNAVSSEVSAAPGKRLGFTREAIADYVEALRNPTAANFASAKHAIDTAKGTSCSVAVTDPLCLTLAELQTLLSKHPKYQ